MVRKKITKAIAFTVLLFAAVFSETVRPRADAAEIEAIVSSIPSDWPVAPEIPAEAAILMDAESGEILYAKNATKTMFPASTTKLATALLTLENASLQDVVKFTFQAVNIPAGSSHIGMRRGESMVLKECLYALLLPSANEVANALAEHVSGDQATFVTRMNDRMKQLGAVNTSFTNTNGLHDEAHYTCAYDLALVMKALSTNSIFLEIASKQSYVHHADELLPKNIPMTNTNMMIRPSSEFYDSTVICGKTGHTTESGFNLVTLAEQDGTRLISVVLGAASTMQYVSTESLLNYGFHYFHSVLPAELDVSLNMENRFTPSRLQIPTPEEALLRIRSTDSILLPDNVTFDKLTKEVSKSEDGIVITYLYKNYPLGTVSLESGQDDVKSAIFAEKEHITAPEKPEPLLVIDGWLMLVLVLIGASSVLTIGYLIRRFMPRKTFRS